MPLGRASIQPVVAELVRRLLQAGVVSRDTLAQALIDSSTERVHLLQKLAERHASILPALDAELARVKGPSVKGPLAIDVAQVLRLPSGLCKRLLAVPLQVEPTSSRWAIAVADLSNRHVMAEISYQLGGPVDAFRAPLAVILNAVILTEERPLDASELPLMDVEDENTPAFGTSAVMPLRRPSGRWSLGEHAGEIRRLTPRRGLSLPPVQLAELPSEPPIPLVRPLSRRTVGVTERPPAIEANEHSVSETKAHRSSPHQEQPSPSGNTPQERTAEILEGLEGKRSPHDVLHGFGDAVSIVAGRSGVFAVRSGQFQLECVFPPNSVPKLTLPFAEPSVLQTACQAGYYLGPLARGALSDELAHALDISADSEIYIVPVVVAERPAALIVAGLIDNTFAATRLIDQIAKRGGAILERLVQRRRRNQGKRA